VGRLQLNAGEIHLFGSMSGNRSNQIPGRNVGFMPQETALYKNFSIREMLQYFGRVHHMRTEEIASRETFLLSFLDLPSSSRRIAQLRLVERFIV
jgi:ABC-type multidrug transport system ATPase subunit